MQQTMMSTLKKLKQTRILVSFLCCAATVQASAANYNPLTENDQLARQREQYRGTLELIKQNRWPQARSKAARLKDYPLYPYIEYADLASNMRISKEQAIGAYLETHAGTSTGRRLRDKWLDYLIRRDDWQRFLRYYDAGKASTEKQCYFHLAQYRAGHQDAAIAAAKNLWDTGKSQPRACDKLFGLLIKGNHIDEPLAWSRFTQALLNHQYQLARYLERFFSSSDYKKQFKLYYEVDRNPSRIGRYADFTNNTPAEISVIEHGLTHLAGKDPVKARQHWQHYQQTRSFDRPIQITINSSIVKGLYEVGKKGEADDYFWQHRQLLGDTLTEWRLREALRDMDWPAVNRWLPLLSETERNTPGWRYWAIRAAETDPQAMPPEQVLAMKKTLARERDFYGFLASEMLQQEYRLNHNPVDVTEQDIERIANLPAIKRARELYYFEDNIDATREWVDASANFSEHDWITLAVINSRWGWHSKAIAALGRARYWDDVEIRFPLAYSDEFNAAAASTQLPAYLLMALGRQESTFDPKATSPVGARGMIQVMPATALETARKFKLPYRNSSDLYKTEINIPIGAHYYKSLMDRFGQNRILATAAYNAGPHRVSRWRAGSQGKLPFDIWIELIPFRETRSYVRNVLMYSVVYARKTGDNSAMLSQREREQLL